MHLHFGVALDILAGEKQVAKVNLGSKTIPLENQLALAIAQ